MTQMRTSWNSCSKELGPGTDSGTAVPLTLPVAPTWGSKFPISRDPTLFLLLPSKPKGPTLKNCRVGWETLNTLKIGSERGNFKFFNFLFQVLFFSFFFFNIGFGFVWVLVSLGFLFICFVF